MSENDNCRVQFSKWLTKLLTVQGRATQCSRLRLQRCEHDAVDVRLVVIAGTIHEELEAAGEGNSVQRVAASLITMAQAEQFTLYTK